MSELTLLAGAQALIEYPASVCYRGKRGNNEAMMATNTENRGLTAVEQAPNSGPDIRPTKM